MEEVGTKNCSFMHLSKIILNFMGEYSTDKSVENAAKVSAFIKILGL